MNANQTLDKVREGLDLSFLAVTRALYQTGDLVKRQNAIRDRQRRLNAIGHKTQGLTRWVK